MSRAHQTPTSRFPCADLMKLIICGAQRNLPNIVISLRVVRAATKSQGVAAIITLITASRSR